MFLLKEKITLVLGDIVTVFVACYLTDLFLTTTNTPLFAMNQHMQFVLLFFVCIGISFNINDLYTVLYKRFAEILLALVVSLVQSAVAVYVIFTVIYGDLWAEYLSLFTLVSFLIMVILRYAAWVAGRRYQSKSQAFVIGTDDECCQMYKKIKKNPHLCLELKFVAENIDATGAWKQAGLQSDIIFVGSRLSPFEKEQILLFANAHGKEIRFIPTIYEIICNHSLLSRVDDIPILRPKDLFLTAEKRVVKRGLDIILASIAALLFLPLMIFVAVLVKISSKGDVLYSQVRVGQNEKPFKVYKFRTMTMDAEKISGPVMAYENDPRITPVGKILRMTRLDELPQIWNVVVGDMSLVGPRPERPIFVEEFNKMMPAYHYRHNVKPGITGFAQIFGKYNTTAADKLVYDLMYIQNCGLKQDLVLILQTIRILFTKSSTEGYSGREDETDLNRYRVGNTSQ